MKFLYNVVTLFKFPSWVGSVPVSWFVCKRLILICYFQKIISIVEIEGRKKEIYKSVIFVKRPNSVGIVPVNEFVSI